MLLATLALGGPAVAAGPANPRCFGAASRDPTHPCENPALRDSVEPTPSDALLVPNAPCTPIPAIVPVCTFGVPPSQASGSIALLGDSHANHWLPAVEVLAEAMGWSGINITHASCPYSQGVLLASNPSRDACITWNRQVVQWFAGEPQISTVFTSDHPAAVERAPGQGEMSAWVAGITAAWAALPGTVRHIVVIRDDPFIEKDTLQCVTRAIARRRDAGLACAFARAPGRGLHVDPDVVAASRLHSTRVQTVDLTPFFCGAHRCYPVIGGVLVYKDYFDHLTRAYATTLGPYLLRAVRALMTDWH